MINICGTQHTFAIWIILNTYSSGTPQSTKVAPEWLLEATLGSQKPDEEMTTQHFVAEVDVAEKKTCFSKLPTF